MKTRKTRKPKSSTTIITTKETLIEIKTPYCTVFNFSVWDGVGLPADYPGVLVIN